MQRESDACRNNLIVFCRRGGLLSRPQHKEYAVQENPVRFRKPLSILSLLPRVDYVRPENKNSTDMAKQFAGSVELNVQLLGIVSATELSERYAVPRAQKISLPESVHWTGRAFESA